MGSVVKTLVTKWRYTVDATQVKKATRDLTKLRSKLLEVRKSSVTFGKQERNQLRTVGKGWRRATQEVDRYRKAKMSANRVSAGGGFGLFGGGRRRGGGFFSGQSGRIATLASTLGAGALGGLAVSAGGLAGVGALLGAGSIGLAGRREQARASIGGLLGGDFEKADILLNNLNEFAKKTPFQIGQLRELSSVLLASGFAAGEVIDNLRVMGDVTRGDNDKLNRMLFNFTQIKNQQRATALDLRQFAMAGIPIYKQLEKQLKVNGTVLRDMTREGKITFEVVEEALRQMTAEGGLFFRGMELQSQTLFGIFSNIKDAILVIGEAIGEEFLEDVKDISKSFKEWAEDNQTPIIRRVKNLKESFAQFWDILVNTNKEFRGIQTAVRGLTVALGALFVLALPKLAVFAGLVLAIDDVMNAMRGNKSVSGKFVQDFKESPTKAFGNVMKTAMDGLEWLIPSLGDVKDDPTTKAALKMMEKVRRDADVRKTAERQKELEMSGDFSHLALDAQMREGRLRRAPSSTTSNLYQTNNISGSDAGEQVLNNTDAMLMMHRRHSRARRAN